MVAPAAEAVTQPAKGGGSGIPSNDAGIDLESQYRSIFENAVEGIFQSVPGGGFRSANPALARMLGYGSPEELIGAIDDVGTQVFAQPQERVEMQRLFETKEMISGHELQVQRRDGTTFWASLSARAVRDPRTGRIQYIEGSAVDVTARRQAEERLHRLWSSASRGERGSSAVDTRPARAPRRRARPRVPAAEESPCRATTRSPPSPRTWCSAPSTPRGRPC